MSTPPEAAPDLAPLIAFSGFAAALARRMGRTPEGWSAGDTLADRLTWDSLRALEVLAWLREVGVELPEELVGELRTLGDLHHYVVTIGTRGEAGPPSPRRPLVGARVRLTPVAQQHQGDVAALYLHGEHLTRYRMRGVTPSPEAFHHALWDRVLAQFVALDGARVVALVSAFEADMRNRHVHIAVVARPDAGAGVGMEAVALLIEHLFAEFDLRKVYAEVLGPNLEAFASGAGRVFEVEGRLVGHEFHQGEYHDMVVMAITRERWATHVDRLLGPSAV